MNGAWSLVRTLLANGVDTVFANPGTSEMHFVAALDAHPAMRCVLCLFEGGASGAADGYFRMKRDIAGTLLHLAPGFGNAFANLHNARKAPSGVLNIVGEHATGHLRHESPLKGDIAAISGAVSHWTRVSAASGDVAADAATAITAARSRNGQVATLVLPADTAWEPGSAPVTCPPLPAPERPGATAVEAAAAALRQPGAVLMIGGAALFDPLVRTAARIAALTGARLIADSLVARLARGAGAPLVEQLPYPVAAKVAHLAGTREMVLVGCHRPVTFFAYPGKPSLPEPPDCRIHDLCPPHLDIAWTLQALADALAVTGSDGFPAQPLDPSALPTGALTLARVGTALAARLPENAMIICEPATAGAHILPALGRARPHDLLLGTGGAIGLALPCALGAALACPDRKPVVITGDGSAMYTLQALWTMARLDLEIIVIVLANRGYQVLRDELLNVGIASAGENARAMFDVEAPTLDWVALARGHGVPGTRVGDMEAFNAAYAAGLAAAGPSLIEVVCP
jgi:acetolactate synthase-1/2/3 large subunit